MMLLCKFAFLCSSIKGSNLNIPLSDKEVKDKDKAAQSLAVPRLSVCADAQKVDRAKLAQTEVSKMPISDPI